MHGNLLGGLLLAATLYAQAPGSITSHTIPTFGLTAIDGQQNTYVASGGFAGGVLCSPMNVAKFGPTGNQVFAINGPGVCGISTRFAGIVFDATGAVYTTGSIDSLSGGVLLTYGFVAKISADGSRFAYVTYFPSSGTSPNAIRVDASGNAYVVGTTRDSHPFAAKLAADGATFTYNAQLPDTGSATGLALDAGGDAYITGKSGSKALVAKVGPSGNVVFSNSFGGAGGANGQAIALDSAANIYIAGDAASDFPTTAGTFQPVAIVPLWNNEPTAYLAKVKPDGSGIVWATYTVANSSGTSLLFPLLLAALPSGDTYLATSTGAGFVAPASAPQPCFGRSFDVLLMHLSPQGALAGATFLGRTQGSVNGMTLQTDGSVLLATYGDQAVAMVSQVRFGDPGWTAAPCLSPDVLNAASFSSGTLMVSPGEIVSLTGFGIGPDAGVSAQATDGHLPSTLGGVQVSFNGIPAPLLYVHSRQVNAQIPFEVNTSIFTAPPISVTLTYAGHTFGPYASDSNWMGPPGIFRLNPGINTDAAALNEDGTVNTPDNPAARGSIVTFFGTGYGPLVPPCQTGGLNANSAVPLFFTGTPVQFPVAYAGSAPGLLCGIDQFNVQVPPDALPGPFLLTPYVNPGYGVTIYIR